jgi:hypothetical protein
MTGLFIVLFIVLFVIFLVCAPVAASRLLRRNPAILEYFPEVFRRALAQPQPYASFARWWSADRDREQAARAIAERYGLTYIGTSNEEAELVHHFFFFRHRARVTIEELVLSGSAAMRESLFTCYDNPRWRSTFAHFTSAKLDLPAFHAGARDFPFRDLTAPAMAFDDSPEFDAAYEVRGEDEAAIRRVLDRFVRARLAVHGGLWIEGKGSELLCGRSDDYTQTGERDAFFQVAREIRAMFEGR